MISIPLNPSVQAVDVPRLSRQCALIIARLRQGPATNYDLAQIALKYTSRTDEIRRYLRAMTGEELVAERGEGGVWIYRLVAPDALGLQGGGL